ncbi:MAG: ABC transporter ATP-binding protein [Deltaproteobacteria bacterium]|nr:ABC transporter ATP-binding protein [Deltaproteobacteria bacterium]
MNSCLIDNLSVEFKTDNGIIRAIDGVSFAIPKGKTVGLVGESGCGKSVTALSIMRLIKSPPGHYADGRIIYGDEDLLTLPESNMRHLRGNRISMIFQEPMTSLNPVFTVGNQIAESICLHQNVKRKEGLERAIHMLDLVGIPSSRERAKSYPHELSGGMRQRVMIAMALACDPDLLIADEPTTALDVTIQAQIMELMQKLQDEIGMSILLITHDLGVVAGTCSEVVVMYAGRVVEKADVHTIFNAPKHPYTVGLLNSMPGVKHKEKRLKTIPGLVPDLLHLPQGCRFQDRCDHVINKCRQIEPELTEQAPEHWARCYNPY